MSILILQMMLNVESLDKFQVGIIVFNKLLKDQYIKLPNSGTYIEL